MKTVINDFSCTQKRFNEIFKYFKLEFTKITDNSEFSIAQMSIDFFYIFSNE